MVRERYDGFIANRAPLEYEKRDNIPNYEKRPEPLPFQLPLSPEESMKHTRVPVGFKLELFASEPDIVNPIYFQWDERGRLWVVETVDYPNELRTAVKETTGLKFVKTPTETARPIILRYLRMDLTSPHP